MTRNFNTTPSNRTDWDIAQDFGPGIGPQFVDGERWMSEREILERHTHRIAGTWAAWRKAQTLEAEAWCKAQTLGVAP